MLEGVDLLRGVVLVDVEVLGIQILQRHAVLGGIDVDPHEIGFGAEPRGRLLRLLRRRWRLRGGRLSPSCTCASSTTARAQMRRD